MRIKQSMIALWMMLLVTSGFDVVSHADEIKLYVSTDGRAGWSGMMATPDGSAEGGPLPSIQAARDAIRAHRAKGEWKSDSINVSIRGGTYFQTEPLVFESQDSGAADAPITYAAYQGEKPVISGGRIIKGFKPVEIGALKLWVAEIEEVRNGKWYFHQLFVNGRRAPRPRLPADGYYQFTGLPTTRPETTWGEGQGVASFKPGDIKKWRNLGDVEITALSLWIESHLHIANVDDSAHRVTFDRASVFRLTNGHTPGDYSRYCVENVFEAMSTPGQWYLNRERGTLYYLPKLGETPDKMEMIAPRLSQLLVIGGSDATKPVAGLHFKGLSFEHVDWSLPADKAGFSQAAVGVPGAILLNHARQCSLRDCNVAHVSTYAIELLTGCENNLINNCVLTDLGAGGVKIGHDTSKTFFNNNEVGPGGLIFHSAVGVWIGNSGDNAVTHNEIHDLYYTGVSVGWTWGYGASNAVRNAVDYNHIHDIGKGMLSDMGGIYTLGPSPGTTLRNNRIHDIAAHGYGGWGIYNDEGSTGIAVEGNIVYRTTHGGYHQHYGKENAIRNNIFAFGKAGQIIRSREEDHISFFFNNNIVYFSEGPLLGSTWGNGHYEFDSNVYYRTASQPFDFAGKTFDEWKKKGYDSKSIIADPKFVDPQKGDFTLKPDSPALALGFNSIDTRQIGRLRAP